MKSRSIKKYIIFTLIGFAIIGVGAYLIKYQNDTYIMTVTLPYICIGIGSGIFGQNLGTVISILTLKKHPERAKAIEIEQKDERNRAISDKAKAKAYDLMVMVYGALILVFALVNIALPVLLTSVAAYLFIVFSHIYFINKYNKEF